MLLSYSSCAYSLQVRVKKNLTTMILILHDKTLSLLLYDIKLLWVISLMNLWVRFVRVAEFYP